MQSSGRTTIALWALIACLLVLNSISIVLFVQQRAKNIRLETENAQQQSEVEDLRAQRETLLNQAAADKLPAIRVIPPAHPGAFADVKETDIPGRYRWIDNDRERGIITLNPDHTFTGERGQKNPAYRWALSRDQLTLEYNRMTGFYTNVESPGIYAGVRTDLGRQRLEKVE